MKNKEYWRISLEEVLGIQVTDKIVEDVISISEMEYETTGGFEQHQDTPEKDEINELKNTIRILKFHLLKITGYESLEIIGESIDFFKRD